MTDLRKKARGQECQVRLPGICNSDPETTVLAHIRLIGISGMGLKAPDLLGAWACSKCHAYCDLWSDPETKVAFARGVYRTINKLIDEGTITW